jgi:hypothetical protein
MEPWGRANRNRCRRKYLMSIRLYPEDCHAIDLLLDQGIRAEGGNKGRSLTSSTSSVAQDRVAAIQSVLGLLEFMPAPPPPANLIKKTLALIESAPQTIDGAPHMPAMHAHRGQPSA